MKSNSIELKELYNTIINSQFLWHKDKFKVFTYEAATGKTTTICKALNDLYIEDKSIKTLIVTKLKVEQEKLKEYLGEKAKVVNAGYIIKEESLYTYPILIITHELYRRLCKDYNRREFYIKGRTNLIIDEQLDLLEIREFNVIKADEMRNNLSKIRCTNEKGEVYELNDIYGKIILKLNNTMNKNYQKEMKFVNIEDETIAERVDFLKQLLNNGDYPKGLKNKKNSIINEVDFIRHFYNNEYVITANGKLYSYNNKIDYFLLDNNILLDASGSFMKLYGQSKKFLVKDYGRIVSHNQTNLTFIEENSTTNSIERDPDKYFSMLSHYIMNNTEKHDKVLLIGREKVDRKETTQYLKNILNLTDRTIEFINFDAMRGKNDWADYSKCFIIHLPNAPFYNYVFQYLYYTKRDLDDDDLKIQKVDTNAGFINNNTLERFKITDVVSSIYQGLKRVNRTYNSTTRCDLYVVTNNKNIQELLISQFKDLKSIKYTNIIERNYDNNLRKDNGHYGIITKWIDNWDGSEIKLITMLNEMKLTRKQFDKVMMKYPELKDLFTRYRIRKGYYEKDKIVS